MDVYEEDMERFLPQHARQDDAEYWVCSKSMRVCNGVNYERRNYADPATRRHDLEVKVADIAAILNSPDEEIVARIAGDAATSATTAVEVTRQWLVDTVDNELPQSAYTTQMTALEESSKDVTDVQASVNAREELQSAVDSYIGGQQTEILDHMGGEEVGDRKGLKNEAENMKAFLALEDNRALNAKEYKLKLHNLRRMDDSIEEKAMGLGDYSYADVSGGVFSPCVLPRGLFMHVTRFHVFFKTKYDCRGWNRRGGSDGKGRRRRRRRRRRNPLLKTNFNRF